MKKLFVFFILSCIVLVSGCKDKSNTVSVKRIPTLINSTLNGTPRVMEEITLSDTLSMSYFQYFNDMASKLDALPCIERPFFKSAKALKYTDSVEIHGVYNVFIVDIFDGELFKSISFELKDRINKFDENISFDYRPSVPEKIGSISYSKEGERKEIKGITIPEAISKFEFYKNYLALRIEKYTA